MSHSYFNSPKFFADLQRDVTRWFLTGDMEVVGQAFDNQPGKLDVGSCLMTAYREEKFDDEKGMMQFVAGAKGELRQALIGMFDNQLFMQMARMTGLIRTLTAERMQAVFANVDKGMDFEAAYANHSQTCKLG